MVGRPSTFCTGAWSASPTLIWLRRSSSSRLPRLATTGEQAGSRAASASTGSRADRDGRAEKKRVYFIGRYFINRPMAWLHTLKTWLNRPSNEARAADCYGALVAQARQPAFYALGHVPDTPQGRFEMLMIHAGLVVSRLRMHPAFAQNLFDIMFGDFDVNLRELGVGDLGVGKR